MVIEDELKRIPDYTRFFTLDEMLAKTRSVADMHPDIYSYKILGHSTDGESIPMLKVGSGATRVLLFACPHPNEPIGAMLIQFLLDELISNESLRHNYTWYLLPCVDPDGTRLNEGWFAGPYTIRNYARHFYRPPSAEQVEWTFPIHYKDLHFDTPIPETKALMKAFELAQPDMVYSLHNAGFGGVYYYISHDLKEVYQDFHEIPEARGLALSLGEAEMPWAVEFAPAVYSFGSIQDAYDYLEKYSDTPPAELIQGGGSSGDYLKNMSGSKDPLLLITELPYFQAKQIADQTPTDQSRREVILAGVEQARTSTLAVKAILERIDSEMTLDSRFYRAVTLFNKQILDGLSSKETWAKEGTNMDQVATVAQKTDELYIGSFYRLLIASMLTRALDLQLATTRSDTLLKAKTDLETLLETWIQKLEHNLDYEAIPIKNLVKVQYGALLAVLESTFVKET
ncbi:MAG: M14 family zinc carboxypeptidase [Deinococcota bacterium]